MSTRLHNLSAAHASPEAVRADREWLTRRVGELGEWFHNLDLNGVSTAPNHFLGDFPSVKWRHIAPAIPRDLAGATVLDIGCNGGFYSIEMKRRGAARVVGIDVDDRYLRQAQFAAETLGLEIEFQKQSVYSLDSLPGRFDFVLFMGVLYHLRYPLFALDKVVQKVAGKLVFQTMIRGSEETGTIENDYQFWDKKVFQDPRFPGMYFIEHQYAGDPTNWWIPNRAAAEGMLRSSGMRIVAHPEPETWIAVPAEVTRHGRTIQELELEGTL
ncbi:MAG: TIGR04290 family methyltransferase [Acidobacteria bacterium]|nr:TIGR04290 family methyltransferase [Acidobacteriota bacterium]